MVSVHITTNVRKFVSDLRQVGVFFLVIPVSYTNKTDSHNLTVILLKMAVTPKPNPTPYLQFKDDNKDMCTLLYIYCIITDTMEGIKIKTKQTLHLKV